MTTALQFFRLFAKEFDIISDDDANAWLVAVPLFVDVGSLSTTDRQNAASALYAAHLVWLEKYQGNGGGVRGAVVSESDDASQLKRSYEALKGSDTLLGASPYGQQFMQLTAIGNIGILTRFGADGTA